MTEEEFLTFYPQFGGAFPDAVLAAFVDSANRRFGDFDGDAEEARRLLTAHRLTLYARTVPAPAAGGASSSFAQLAASGDGGRITGKRVDDVSVTYGAGFSASGSPADLGETVYGLQLLGLLRLHAFPVYIP